MLIPPLCEQLIGRCTAHQAVREGEVVGLDASVWHGVHHRPHLAAPSQLAALDEKKTHFCQMPLPVSSCSTSKGCREREAGSISKLQRQRQEQRYSLIVTHDLYMYMSQASIHWGPVLILDLRDSGNTIGDWNYFSISNAFCYYTKSYICRLKY